MRLLVLGGTKNLGRHVVEAALRDGHEVTLFNRGTTNPGLFPEVRRMIGDRADPSALAAGEWDCVIDMSGFLVRDVRLSAEVLRDRVGRYTYMSSIGVYADRTTPGQDESGGLLPWPVGAPDNEFTMDLYGPSKVRCESLLAATFGSRAAAVRSGFVVGRYNPDFGNWGTALASGNRMESAAPPSQPVQYVDARDLADFLLLELSGPYNAVGPTRTMAELAAAWRSVVPDPAPMDWAPTVDRFHLNDEGLFRLDNGRALAAGLRLRPDEETARDYVAWVQDGNIPPDPPH
ncbi:SDR family oxidoreductase [Kribbella albertanoniae]|uniref:NAD-dependent dehydratase n=1 Tax=Kribbella albertanoniae TaxID=1266829 RepID=A0A4R4P4Q7_9ACTN|nr:NAD-dependent dehydratase [Kribbella albertanoniae]TDC15032.1 NAD-dependent dehydratase [Kribbella albertanoniae]